MDSTDIFWVILYKATASCKLRRNSVTDNFFNVEYIYGFVRWGGLQAKSMMSQRAEPSKMAGMRYHGNVMTTTRWQLYVTMETHLQQQK